MVNESENNKLFLCYKLISKTKYDKENLFPKSVLFVDSNINNCTQVQKSHLFDLKLKYKSWNDHAFKFQKEKESGNNYVFWN